MSVENTVKCPICLEMVNVEQMVEYKRETMCQLCADEFDEKRQIEEHYQQQFFKGEL